MKRLIFASVLSLFFVLVLAQAEEIQLKDGTKVTGSITGVVADKFQVKTAYGEIQVPRTEIISISFPENAPKKEASEAIPDIDQSLDGHIYRNRTEKFQITLPDGWTLAPEQHTHDVHGAVKSADQTLFMVYTPEKFAGNVSTYIVLVESQFQGRFKDYEKLSQTEVTLDGKKVTRLLWRAKNPAAHDAPLEALVYVVPFDGKVARLSFMTLEPLFKDALPVFEKMAASYHATDTAK